MSDINANGSGAAPATTAASSPGADQTQSNQPETVSITKAEIEQLRKKASNYDKVQEVYNSYPDLGLISKRVISDPEYAARAKALAENQSFPGYTGQSKQMVEEEPQFDDKQRAYIQKLIEQVAGEKVKGVQGELEQVRRTEAQRHLDECRMKFTKAQGFPVNFSEVETEIEHLLTRGEATNLQAAYMQVAGKEAIKQLGEKEKQLIQQKQRMSMSTGTLPSIYPTKKPGEKVGLHQAFQDALETLGQK